MQFWRDIRWNHLSYDLKEESFCIKDSMLYINSLAVEKMIVLLQLEAYFESSFDIVIFPKGGKR